MAAPIDYDPRLDAHDSPDEWYEDRLACLGSPSCSRTVVRYGMCGDHGFPQWLAEAPARAAASYTHMYSPLARLA